MTACSEDAAMMLKFDERKECMNCWLVRILKMIKFVLPTLSIVLSLTEVKKKEVSCLR